jgi:hypothetical protein
MRYAINNSFHNTHTQVTIRDGDKYAAIGDGDVLVGLESAAHADRDAYALRKLSVIKAELCGSSNCRCSVTCCAIE